MPSAKHKPAHQAVNTPPSRDPELMRRMYVLLQRCREALPRAHGVEATLVGSLIGLFPEDSLLIAHAGAILEILYAKNSAPELLDLAPLDAKSPELETDAQIALAAGYALERSLREKPGIVLAFAGETTSLSSARATLTFAATHRLPLVIVVQHNLTRCKSAETLSDVSHEILGAGLPGMTVDGSDAMAIYRVTQEAMFRARHGSGPTLLECKTFPRRPVPARLRAWIQGDALDFMEQQLRARQFWNDSLIRR